MIIMIKKTDTDTIEYYSRDASNYHGTADVVYIPEDQAELIKIVAELSGKNIPITIAGGLTGLTGSGVPLSGAVISTEKLNQIIEIDKDNLSVVLEPGVRVFELQAKLHEINLFYPPNPTETNSTIGGNISTNASGSRTFKYGATRNFVDRLKVVLANGDILDLRRGEVLADGYELNVTTLQGNEYTINLPAITMPAIKHAAGYYIKENMDAIDLFIGSEGTLGIIAEATMRVVAEPEKLLGGILFFDNETQVLEFADIVRAKSLANNKFDYRKNLDISFRLIEYFDSHSLGFMRNIRSDIPAKAVAALWIEQEMSRENETAIMDELYSLLKEKSQLADEAWIGADRKAHLDFQDFRHALALEVHEKLVTYGQEKIGTDTAVPNDCFKEYFDFIIGNVKKTGLKYFAFGHIGNCHVHTDLFVDNESESQIAHYYCDTAIKKALDLGGTVSAEHGIGKKKKKSLELMYRSEAIESMKLIKSTFDPKNLLCRGNLF